MKKAITSFFIALTIALAGSAIVALPTGAIDVFKGSACSGTGSGGLTGGSGSSSSSLCGATSSDDAPSLIKNVINILLYLVGIIGVLAIIIGGIRYVTSNGDAGAVKSAKDTVMYAVIGIVVAIMAYAIVNFVVKAF